MITGFIIVFLIVGSVFLFLTFKNKSTDANTMDIRYQQIIYLLGILGTSEKKEKIKSHSFNITTKTEKSKMVFNLREVKEYLNITLTITDLKDNSTQKKEWRFNKYLNPERMLELIKA